MTEKADILLQRSTPGDHYLLFANSQGEITGINQTISSTALGLAWSADQHKLLAGDFDGNGKADLFFQATSTSGLNAVALADTNGLFTAVPTQSWNDGYLGFKWSSKNSNIHVGDFDGDSESDLLVQAKPNIVLIDYDIPIPVPTYPPNLNGVILSQGGATPFQLAGAHPWSRNANGVDWSPNAGDIVIGDFDGNGTSDVLLQARHSGRPSNLLRGNSSGSVFTTASELPTNVTWSSDAYSLTAGDFDGVGGAGVYYQAQTSSGTNYYANVITEGSVSVTVHDPLGATGVLPASAVGHTLGSFAVSNSGAATYSISIVVPPGVAGMQPGLSINYQSGAGNGVLGVGWSIAGMSAVTRCRRTWVQDGDARDIRRDFSDRFCLDGNKLRLTGGTYGNAGATYQTEVATFSSVTSLGTAGNGPSSFTVKSKDGLTYEYGNTTDSRIEIIGYPEVRTWALNKITDTAGNAMVFTYTEDTVNGSYRIATIRYTSNSIQGLAAAYTVEFVYATRPSNEIDSSYIAGGVIKEITRLDRIDVRHNTSIVRRYELTYEDALSSTSKSRLAALQECAGSPLHCFPATTFAYQNGTLGLGSEVNTGVSMPASPWPLDVNGDGRDDLVYSSNATSGAGTWMVMFANASGGYNTPVPGPTNTNYLEATPIDFNADGFEDLLVPYSGGTWWVMLGSASGLAAPVNTFAPATATGTGRNARAIDINGDGLEDLVWADLVGYGGGDAIRYRLREGSAFSPTLYTLAGPYLANTAITNGVFGSLGQHSPRRVPDFNGDGRGDVTFRITTRVWIDGPNTWRYFRVINVLCPGGWSYAVNSPEAPSAPYFGDFNGDGKTDILYYSVAGIGMRFSTGTSLTSEVPVSGGVPNDFAILDWDGDGNDDMLTATAGVWQLRRSTGESFSAAVSTGLAASNQVGVVDANGDGLFDLGSNVSGTWRYRTHAGSYPDLLQAATDGFGSSITFNYAPLTSANYSKYADASFPEQDYRGSMYVVNSYSASNGIGGSFTNSFWYYGARLHLQGRGFEGFYAKRTHDSRNGLYDYQYYRRDFPYTGGVFQDDLYQSNGSTLIRRLQSNFTTTTLDSTPNNQRHFPYISSSGALSYEVGGTKNGQLISTAATNYAFDTSGNATNVATTVTDNDTGSPYHGLQWTSTTAKTISPQPGCLGLPTQITVTNSAPGVPTLTRTTGYTPNYTYCRMSQVVTEPASGTYRVTHVLGYDGFGNLNSEAVTGIGMTARTTNLNWGTTGQFPVWITNPLSQKTEMGYDYGLGVQTSQKDPNGLTLNWSYDGFGRRTSELRPDGTSSSTTYALCSGPTCINSNHRMTVTQTSINVGGSVLTDQFTYLDQFDRPLATSQRLMGGAYNRVETRYDALGRVSQQSAPCAAASCTAYWSTFAYDAVNRLTLQQRPISATIATLQSTSVAYLGRTTIVTDAQNRSTTRISTVAGTLGRSQDHNGYYQGFTYDAFGSLLSVSDSLSNALFSATYDYGARAFQRSIFDMDLGTRSYTYNALGELTSGSDGKGQSFSATYDGLSRPLTREEPEGTTSFTYGGTAASHNIGQLQSVSSPDYSEQYAYDTLGRLSNRQIVSDATYAYDYTYNGTTGLPDTLTYPVSTSGYRLKLQYLYQNGSLQQVKDYNASTVFWQANATNFRGQVTQETLGNGVVTNRALDAVTGWVSNIQSGIGGGTTLQNESYQFDLMGNVTQRQNNNLGLAENFYYDNLYRLDYSTLGGTTNLDLSYDPMGNITSRSDVASGAAWTYDTTKKHAVRQAGSASYTYTYDANGNAQTRNGYSIAWTSYNYPSAINGPGKTLTFSYGPDRQRYKQVYDNGSTIETTMYIGGMLEKVTAGGVIDWRHYVSAGGQTVAILSRQSTGTNTTRYMLEDHQGSVAQITDSAGASHVSESFTAFGARRDASTWSGGSASPDLAKMESVTRRGYTGHEAIGGVSMGLNHMNGRVQDAITGRFLSPDPYVTEPGNTQNYNRYSYVGNNPLSYTDPSGFETVILGAIDPDNRPVFVSPLYGVDSGHYQQLLMATGPQRFRSPIPLGSNEIGSADSAARVPKVTVPVNPDSLSTVNGFWLQMSQTTGSGSTYLINDEPAGLADLRRNHPALVVLENDLWQQSLATGFGKFVQQFGFSGNAREHMAFVFQRAQGSGPLRFDVRAAQGAANRINGTFVIPKGFELIAVFHTHPFPFVSGPGGYQRGPSDGLPGLDDIDTAKLYPNAFHYIRALGHRRNPALEEWYYYGPRAIAP